MSTHYGNGPSERDARLLCDLRRYGMRLAMDKRNRFGVGYETQSSALSPIK